MVTSHQASSISPLYWNRLKIYHLALTLPPCSDSSRNKQNNRESICQFMSFLYLKTSSDFVSTLSKSQGPQGAHETVCLAPMLSDLLLHLFSLCLLSSSYLGLLVILILQYLVILILQYQEFGMKCFVCLFVFAYYSLLSNSLIYFNLFLNIIFFLQRVLP